MQALLRCPYIPCACTYICAHVKDPVVHVRVRWIMETLKRSTCRVIWVARLCRSWLSPGKATRIFHGRNPIGTIQLLKKIYKKVQDQVQASLAMAWIELHPFATVWGLDFKEKKKGLDYFGENCDIRESSSKGPPACLQLFMCHRIFSP